MRFNTAKVLSTDIIVPKPYDCVDIARLRARVFSEQLVTVGVSKSIARKHVADLKTPQGFSKYYRQITEWLDDPLRYVRAVEVRTNRTRFIGGLFTAELADLGEEGQLINIVELDECIRGRDIGRTLMQQFFERNPHTTTELDVLEGNDAAIQFYEQLGFQRVITPAKAFRIYGGNDVPALRMQRPPQTTFEFSDS